MNQSSRIAAMQYSLRTLMILLVVGPLSLAAASVAIHPAVSQPKPVTGSAREVGAPPKPATWSCGMVTPRIVIVDEDEELL